MPRSIIQMIIAGIGRSIRRHLGLYTLTAVAAGLATSRICHGVSLKYLIPFGLFMMLYPAFLDVEGRKVTDVVARPRALLAAMMINFILSPVLMYGLTSLFSNGMDSGLLVGLLIFGMIPAGGMGPVYTKMVGGNVNLAVAISTVSLLLSLATIPLWSCLLIGRILTVPHMVICQYLLMIIVAPLIIAAFTRRWIVRNRGLTAFMEFKELFQGTSTIGLMLLVFIIFVLNGRCVIKDPSSIVNLLFPTASFSLLLLIGSTGIGQASRLPYEDSVALAISSTLKNTAISMALATSVFHGREALAVAVAGPLVQFPVMLFYMRILTRYSSWRRAIGYERFK
jgi:ACR3 family arsenite transporter